MTYLVLICQLGLSMWISRWQLSVIQTLDCITETMIPYVLLGDLSCLNTGYRRNNSLLYILLRNEKERGWRKNTIKSHYNIIFFFQNAIQILPPINSLWQAKAMSFVRWKSDLSSAIFFQDVLYAIPYQMFFQFTATSYKAFLLDQVFCTSMKAHRGSPHSLCIFILNATLNLWKWELT